MMKQSLIPVFALMLAATHLPASAATPEACLKAAYPSAIASINNGSIHFHNGSSLPVGNISGKPFTQVLNAPSIAEQLMQPYPLNFKAPKQYEDAGRIRNDDFFKQLYGGSAAAVRANLVSARWQPSGKSVQFNRQNGAAAQLEKVGREIAAHSDLVPYVNKTLGSFNYRTIAGTKRLSAHSFGIAIDFQLPKHLHKYWRWDGCTTENKPCRYPQQLMNDEKLQRIVRIFEKHGFIWGGKWASYDSVHFEYRPELLHPACR